MINIHSGFSSQHHSNSDIQTACLLFHNHLQSASFKPRSYPSFLTHHIPLRWYTHLTLLVPKMELANLNALYDCCVALEYSVNGILKGSVQMWSTMLLKTADERGMQWSWISTTVESGYWKTSERCWEEVCLTMLGLLELWYSLNVSEDF